MPDNPRILVLGAGAWGTALALVLTRNEGNEVFLWGRDAGKMDAMRRARCNEHHLPGVRLPERLRLLTTERDLPSDIGVIVAAVPFQTLRPVLEFFADAIAPPGGIACASKGLEKGSFQRADQIVADVYQPDIAFAMLSGPNFAVEVAERRPAAITVATRDEFWGRELVRRFHSQLFRPYLTDDVIGVEIGGAIKNVMAIAAGIADGLGLGANSRAALITRGLAEITRFGVAQGGRLETFMGLSGLGDLVLTCTDDKSRNRRFGLHLAAGEKVEDAIAEIGLVEGATTAMALVELADDLGIEMPISREVADTITGKTTPEQAVRNLLARDPVAESEGLVSPFASN
jgi:glycerol-3-phosphate dehydrogenase (NAD(P)+)